MKKIYILLLLLSVGTYVGAQTMDTVRIVRKARKFRPSEHFLLMFEIMDTTNASGRKVTVSRSYYFDKQRRKMSSVRENDNPEKPKKGTQVIYSFADNRLSAVTVIPPRSTCRNCASQYNFGTDSLLSKQENGYTHANPEMFLKQARAFQAKMPQDLPWGFFEDEVIINGQKKKLRKLD